MLVDADEIPLLLAPYLEAPNLLRLLACCRKTRAMTGFQLTLSLVQQASRARKWQMRFGHRLTLVSLNIYARCQEEVDELVQSTPGLRNLTARLRDPPRPAAQPAAFSLATLAGRASLRTVDLHLPSHLYAACALDPLAQCSRLQRLKIQADQSSQTRARICISGLATLRACASLRSLELKRCSGVGGDGGLCGLALPGSALTWALEALTLQDCDLTSDDLTNLPALLELRELDLSRNPRLDLGGGALGRCAQLRTLTLTGCTALTDVVPLATCTNLASLYLTGCKQLADVGALVGCPSLHTLHLNHCRALRDASALVECPALELVNLRCSGVVQVCLPVRPGLRVVLDTSCSADRSTHTVGVL